MPPKPKQMKRSRAKKDTSKNMDLLGYDTPFLSKIFSFMRYDDLLRALEVNTAWRQNASRELTKRTPYWLLYEKASPTEMCLTGAKRTRKSFRKLSPTQLRDELGKFVSRFSGISDCLFYFTTTEVCCNDSFFYPNDPSESLDCGVLAYREIVKRMQAANGGCPFVMIECEKGIVGKSCIPECGYEYADGEVLSALSFPQRIGCEFIPFYMDRDTSVSNGDVPKWKFNTAVSDLDVEVKGALLFGDIEELSANRGDNQAMDEFKRYISDEFYDMDIAGIYSTVKIRTHFPGRKESFSPVAGFYIVGDNVTVDCIGFSGTYICPMKLYSFKEKLDKELTAKKRPFRRLGLYFGAYSPLGPKKDACSVIELRAIEKIFPDVHICGIQNEEIFYMSRNVEMENGPELNAIKFSKASTLCIITIFR